MSQATPEERYRSAALMGHLTGRSEQEVQWIWARMAFLMRDAGMNAHDAAQIAQEEAKTQPWLT